MEKLYLFVLGRDPELSKIEIESLLQNLNIDFEILDSNKNIAVVKLKKLDSRVLATLGGTIKVAEVISNTNRPEEIENNLENYEIYKGTKNKITYYIEVYATELLTLAEDFLKDYFKKIKLKATYRKQSSPSALTKKNTEDFLELIIYKNFIGITTLISNPKELKERDLNRPDVDYMKSISIRLAKILVNISKVKESQLLIDPFCGSGTILQEALLNNINVIGLDTDRVSIGQTKKNLEWLKEAYPIKADYRLFNLDCRKLSSVIKKADAIVTEPYLGPFIRKLPNIDDATEIISELTDLYDSLLKQANLVLSKGKRFIIIIPRLRTKESKTLFIDINDLAESNGFYLAYKPVLYAYQESKIIREICVLERN